MNKMPDISNLSSSQLIYLQNEISKRLSPENPLDKLPKETVAKLQNMYNDLESDAESFEVKAVISVRCDFELNTDNWTVEGDIDSEIDWDYHDVNSAVESSKEYKSWIKDKETEIKKFREEAARACRKINITEKQLVALL